MGRKRGGAMRRFGTGGAAHLWRSVFCILALVLALSGSAAALPQGETVAHGAVSFDRTAAELNITQATQKAIINWNAFSIANGELVAFSQPNSSAAALNRVTGSSRSDIMGLLTANGNVLLLNPNGILIGPDAQVNVHGLVASTLNLGDEDFLNSEYVFQGPGGPEGVVNQGRVEAASGGYVFFIGPGARNSGDILAPQGRAALASATEVYLSESPDGLVLAHVELPAGAAENLGQIIAERGWIDMYGDVVNQGGYVSASSVELGPGGAIGLVARSDATLAAGSTTEAAGGAVVVESADGSIAFEPDASLDVSGGVPAGDGANSIEVQASDSILMSPGAEMDAGSGSIMMRAESDIRISRIHTTNDTAGAVAISTTGGAVLDAEPSGEGDDVDIVANSPGAGVIIESAGGVGGTEYLETAVHNLEIHNSGLGQVRIQEADDLALKGVAQGADADLHISAGRDITVAGGGTGITSAASGGHVVEMNAGRELTINQDISADGAAVNLYALEDVVFGGGAYLDSGGGDVLVSADHQGGGAPGGGVFMNDGAFIDAGAGTIDVQAEDSIWLGGLRTQNDTAGAVRIESRSGELVDNGDADIEVTANSPAALTTMSASTGIGITPAEGADSAIEVSLDNLDATTETGGINLNETDAIDIRRLAVSTWGKIDLIGSGTIAVLGEGPGISTEGPGRSDDVHLTSLEGDIVASRIVASDTAFLRAGGRITDGGEDATDIAAPLIGLVACNGIADNDMLEVDATGLAAATERGDINITDVAGGLEITDVEGLSGVAITDGGPDDDIVLIAESPLRISRSVTNVGGGRIMLVAQGATEGDDLSLDAPVVAAGGDGDIQLFAGDSIVQSSNVTASGEGSITMAAGYSFVGGALHPGTATGAVTVPSGSTVAAEAGNVTVRASARVSLSGSVLSEGGDATIAASSVVTAPGSLVAAPGGIVHIQAPAENTHIGGDIVSGDYGATVESLIGGEAVLLGGKAFIQTMLGEVTDLYRGVAVEGAPGEVAPAEEEEEEEARAILELQGILSQVYLALLDEMSRLTHPRSQVAAAPLQAPRKRDDID